MKKILVSLFMLAMVFGVNAQDLEELLGQMAGSGVKATYEKSYEFESYIQMSLSDLEDNTIVYDGYLTREGNATAILFNDAGAKSLVILDTDNHALLLLTEDEGEKTGIALAIDPEALEGMSEEINDEPDQDYEAFKTGKTREILGYKCEEYVIHEDDTRVQMWVSPRLGKEIETDLIANEQVFGGAFLHATSVNGMVMEYNYTDENSGETRKLKVTKIDLEARKTISTGDYAIMSIGQ